MGCQNSKAKDQGTGEITVYSGPGGPQPPPAQLSSSSLPMRPPIATTHDILRIGNTGDHHEALVAYSMNARNGYDVRDGTCSRRATVVEEFLFQM